MPNSEVSLSDAQSVERLRSALMALLEQVDSRFSLPQAIFLLEVAAGTMRGQDRTYSDIKASFGDLFSAGLNSSYTTLLVPDGKSSERGLGFVARTSNPNDLREKILTLTPEGHDVVAKMIEAIGA